MTALACVWLETSEAETEAAHEGRGKMGSRHRREKGRKKRFSISAEEAVPDGAMVQVAASLPPPPMLGTAAFGFQALLR